MALVELRNITKTYGSGPAQVHALREVSLTLSAGEFTAFCGPSGSGKTTLLNQVGCLDSPSSGTVMLEGKAVTDLSGKELARLRAKRIGFIFQSFNLIPVLTARENVELALQLAGMGENKRERAIKMLQEVGLEGLENRRPNQLSGGQQQRVAIARALVKQPALVIADEPTANLDSHTGAKVLDLMRQMNAKHGVTFLFSTHDPMVMGHARRLVTLRDGVIYRDEEQDVPEGPISPDRGRD